MSVKTINDISTGAGQRLYTKAKRLIPGGTQLLSKRPEMLLPDLWPCYYSRAKGARIWDLDGKEFLDMSYSGIGACVLGYANPVVDGAVRKAITAGTMATLNCPEEVELAELLIALHPWAEMVRYTRNGGEAMAVAARIARAATGRDKIAFCGYHGWHDWYLAANLAENSNLDGHLLPGLSPKGVPRELQGTVLPFQYNRADELEQLARQHRNDLAAIIMEPVRNHNPEPGFLEQVRAIASRERAVLIFDEITSGWRLNTGGAHLTFGVNPDVAVFAKGMSNGYPMGAILGIRSVMEAAQTSFISSTYWTERVGPVAAIATIREHKAKDVASHLCAIGSQIQQGWKALACKWNLPLEVSGIAPLGHFTFTKQNHQAIRTLFSQLMLEKGILATNAFYAMYAHSRKHASRYLDAADEVFSVLSKAIGEDAIERMLKGPVAHSGFRRLT
jgi:glutamate-1-semialdehyde 2,1-aminomutase